MTAPWFHVDSLPPSGGVVVLEKKEARHALGPRRLGDGDEVVVFDGRGTSASARIGSRDERGGLELVVGDHHQAVSEHPSIELAASLPKGDRLSTMLDMATQLGIAAFTPLKCTFSVVSLDRKRQDPTERWARIMVEACKQSRRASLPAIREQATPTEVIERAATEGATIVVGDASGRPPAELFSGVERVVVLVGPEGGFSPAEESMLTAASDAGRLHRIAIGRGVLRVEAAATAMLAAIRSHGRD
ncbi:MAG: 16S rRNA (uracil(1498)-N(3))-methyltransferase [Phycisphaera sp.]|nr:16S rRNA (uracil(1498)-N(3))-methyltransferase [Phycisphaera sp.]